MKIEELNDLEIEYNICNGIEDRYKALHAYKQKELLLDIGDEILELVVKNITDTAIYFKAMEIKEE